MRIAVSVESTNDMTIDLIKKYDVSVVPFNVLLGDETFKDGQITTEQIFESVEKTGVLPKTNAINQFEYGEYFESLKKDYDAVIHICLSSSLSCSCQNATNAAKEIENVYVIDSKSLSTGIGLLAIYTRELAEQGVEVDEIVKKVTDRVSKVQASFVIERLDYLYKGGRCNSLQLFGANLLKLRPRIVVANGKMSSDKKYRGNMEKVVAKYCQETLADFNTPDLDKVFITYTTATPEMVEAARTAVKEAGFKNIFETRAGCTIASHCGGNTLGILYFNDGE